MHEKEFSLNDNYYIDSAERLNLLYSQYLLILLFLLKYYKYY